MAKKVTEYASIQEWMEKQGRNGRQLIRLVHDRYPDVRLSEGHLSNILKGSRRCSLRLAVALHEITRVPITVLAKWPHVDEKQTSRSAA